MPLYEYQCETCGRFEKIVKFSDPPLEACPTCGGAVQKLFSSPAFQFKGSGWYITDYAKKPSPESSGGTSAEKSSSEKSSSEKSSNEKSSNDHRSDKSTTEKSSEKSSGDSSSSAAAPAAATSTKD